MSAGGDHTIAYPILQAVGERQVGYKSLSGDRYILLRHHKTRPFPPFTVVSYQAWPGRFDPRGRSC